MSDQEPRTFGEYPDLVAPKGDPRRGKTHCRVCGGRTTYRDSKRKACHPGCDGNKMRKGKDQLV